MARAEPGRAGWRHRTCTAALVALLALTGIVGMHVVDSRTAGQKLPEAVVTGHAPDGAGAPVLDVSPDRRPPHDSTTCRSCVTPLVTPAPLDPVPEHHVVPDPGHQLPSLPADPSAPPP